MDTSFNLPKSYSPTKKILAIVTIAFILQTVYYISHHYYSVLEEAQTMSLSRLKGIANSVVLQISGDEHQALTQRYLNKDALTHSETDSVYSVIHRVLAQNHAAAQLNSPIYTLIYDKEQNEYEFGVTSSIEPYYRHKYLTCPSDLFQNNTSGGIIPLYKDEFGSWLSAFAPIKNSKGEVVAMLMVDQKFDDIIQYIQSSAWQNVRFSIFIFIFLILILIHILQTILKKEEQTKNALSKAYLEKKTFSDKLFESEMKLKDYSLQLEKSNQELTDFANIASHDLKAPIRGILSFSQLLEKRNKNKFDERDFEYINFIKSSSYQSLALVEGLLSYSKIDKNLGKPQKVDIKDAINIALSNMKLLIEEKKADIQITELPTVVAHQLLIIQLFQNLINNGLKYNENECPKIVIGSFKNEHDSLTYFVKDNGIGIAEEYQKEVFAMFRRLHSTSQYEGSGIGLAFCTRIIDTYKGQIWLKSEIGKGTTFFFTLPQAAPIVELVSENSSFEESSLVLMEKRA
jgi:signal transduction histidine kinase